MENAREKYIYYLEMALEMIDKRELARANYALELAKYWAVEMRKTA